MIGNELNSLVRLAVDTEEVLRFLSDTLELDEEQKEYITNAREHINETLDVSSYVVKSYARESRATQIE